MALNPPSLFERHQTRRRGGETGEDWCGDGRNGVRGALDALEDDRPEGRQGAGDVPDRTGDREEGVADLGADLVDVADERLQPRRMLGTVSEVGEPLGELHQPV
ncbi:MAG: hypothetical protein QM747_15135 [Nocardioides sp.]